METVQNKNEQLTQLKERVVQLETCYRITSLLNSELQLTHLLDTIMQIAKKVMKADACSLLLLDEQTQELVFQIALSEVSDQIRAMDRLKMGQGIAGTVAQSGQAIIIEDAYSHPKFNPGFDKKTGFKTGSILCSPLKSGDDIIGVCQVIHRKDQGVVFDSRDLELFQMFCDSAALAIQKARIHEILMENQRLEKDMEFAKSVQESFLPGSPPEYEGYEFAAKTIPARVVGGDYYDFIPVDEHVVGVVLGDVSGKGVPAALQMARLMSDFRYISQIDPSPAKVLTEVNNIFCQRSYRGMFTTAVFLLIDLKRKTMQVANAGHPSLLLRNKDNQISELAEAGGLPLGIVPQTHYDQKEFQLRAGDRMVIYSDGVVEPKNENNEVFGFERLVDLLKTEPGSPADLIQNIENSIQTFMGDAPQFDDLTCVAFQVR